MRITLIILGMILLAGCMQTAVEDENKKSRVYVVTEMNSQVSDFEVDTTILDQCRDLCGDGFCNEYRCIGENCTSVTNSCPENEISCPQDCK